MTARHYHHTVAAWLPGWLSWLWTLLTPGGWWLELLFLLSPLYEGLDCTTTTCYTWFTAEKNASAIEERRCSLRPVFHS